MQGLGQRHIGFAWQGDGIFDRENLAHDAHRDLRRRLATDVNADRATQTRQRFGRLIEVLDHPAASGFGVATRADGADIERVTLQRLKQRQVVQLGVVRERDDATAAVGLEGDDRVVGHLGGDRDAGHRPRGAVLDTRIAQRDRKAAELCHCGKVLGELARADQQHAVLGAESVDQLLVIHRQFVRRLGLSQPDCAVCERHRALHQLAGFKRGDQCVERGDFGVVFEQQLERAAAWQAEAMRLVCGDAILDERRRTAGNLFSGAVRAAVTRDQIVLDAAS